MLYCLDITNRDGIILFYPSNAAGAEVKQNVNVFSLISEIYQAKLIGRFLFLSNRNDLGV
jgi:hypothetical protein